MTEEAKLGAWSSPRGKLFQHNGELGGLAYEVLYSYFYQF